MWPASLPPFNREGGKQLKAKLDMQPMDLASVVAAAIEMVRLVAMAKEIRVTLAISVLSGVVMGDKDRFQQVVWNFLTNAVKLTKKGGEINVGVKRDDGQVEIEVADTGEGMAPAFLGQVFDRSGRLTPRRRDYMEDWGSDYRSSNI